MKHEHSVALTIPEPLQEKVEDVRDYLEDNRGTYLGIIGGFVAGFVFSRVFSRPAVNLNVVVQTPTDWPFTG